MFFFKFLPLFCGIFLYTQAVEQQKKNFSYERIVGGSPTTIEQYPFVVSMWHSLTGQFTYQACAGSLLTSRTVLSAASCYWGDVAENWIAQVGASTINENAGTFHQVSQLRLHESFSFATMDYDVAVVVLAHQVTLGNINDAALVAGASFTDLPVGQSLTVIGWGKTSESGESSEVLQFTTVAKVANDECSARYDQARQIDGFSHLPQISTRMVCAGVLDVGGRDACQGDAGGPLIYAGNIIVGIVSWGKGCGDPTYPGVYTSIPSLVQWIADNGSV